MSRITSYEKRSSALLPKGQNMSISNGSTTNYFDAYENSGLGISLNYPSEWLNSYGV